MKISVIGPESSGKTTLSERLAEFFDAELVEEYSRIFLVKQEGKYVEEDLIDIARGQYNSLKKAVDSNFEFIVQDTDILSIKVWSDIKYGRCNPQILEFLNRQEIDFYILCLPDLPWEKDPLRETPDMNERKEIYHQFEKELKKNAFEYFIVEGQGDMRWQGALRFVQESLKIK